MGSEEEATAQRDAAIDAVQEWMGQARTGAPDKVLDVLDDWARDWGTDWGTGSMSTIIDILDRCVTHDFSSSGRTNVGFVGLAPDQRLGRFGVEAPADTWRADEVGGGSILRFEAGLSFHLLAKVHEERVALLVHSAGDGIQDLAGKDQHEALAAADAKLMERQRGAFTWDREDLARYELRTVADLARWTNARKVYESDLGFHTVQFGALEEQAILSDPSLTNARLVWER